MSRGARTDPFTALGLPARAGLSDADVQAAWRRIAAATHPDRADGGDPGRFAQAAAAYHVLRTATGRLLLRAAAVAAASAGVVLAAGARPAVPAVIAGLLTWLVLTGRQDLAPPR